MSGHPRRGLVMLVTRTERQEEEEDDDGGGSDTSMDSGTTSSSAAAAAADVLAAMRVQQDVMQDALDELDAFHGALSGLAQPMQALDAEALADAAYLRASPLRAAPLRLTPSAAARLVPALVPSASTTFEAFATGLRAYVVAHGLAVSATGAIAPDALLRDTLLPGSQLGSVVSFFALLGGVRHIALDRRTAPPQN